jgi:WD40 repeat protein
VGNSDSYAQIFDMMSGKEISRIPHIGDVTGLAFSADGKQLFTVSRKVVQVWDISKLVLTPTDKLIETACSRLVANLSLTEWQTLFSTEPYRLICPNLPQGKD